jgi:hypothetical protein
MIGSRFAGALMAGGGWVNDARERGSGHPPDICVRLNPDMLSIVPHRILYVLQVLECENLLEIRNNESRTCPTQAE